jgi:hypothetical protein
MSQWVVTAFYGSEQTIPSTAYPEYDRVPVNSSGQITFDASATIQGNGSLYLQGNASTLVPVNMTDPLAPYGQTLQIVRRVFTGGAYQDVPLGIYRIQDVPDARNLWKGWPTIPTIMGWSAQLTICDLFDIIDADNFLATTQPTPGNTVWEEIQALSPLPVVQSLPDQSIPAGVVYQSRMDAIAQLITVIGGEPHLTRQGALTARVRNNWLTATTTVATVNGVVDVAGGMSNNLKNSVVVTNPNNASILAIAEITEPSNPLCVTGPLGRRTQTLSDPLMTTQAMAQTAANTMLARLSSQNSRTVTVSCLPRPDLELGDYIEVIDERSQVHWFGEVRQMSFSLDATQLMSITLTVAETQ